MANNLSVITKLSKTQISKITQWSQLLARLLGPLQKTGLTLIKNLFQTLAKSVLIPLGLTAAAADAGIHKNFRVWYNSTNNIKWTFGRYYENS